MPSLEAFGGVRDRRGHKLPRGFRKGGRMTAALPETISDPQ
jgi:hypothetical protein